MGFFDTTSLPVVKTQRFHSPQCGKCRLFERCKSPKMEPTGRGRRRILVLAEAPGKDEDDKGIQLVGKSGKRLEREMAEVGIDMRRDCILTNALVCRPENNEIPDPRMIGWCRPNLTKTIEEFKPEVIIPLGAIACESLFGWLYKEDVGGIGRWAGWVIPDQTLNAWVCPTFHPAHLERNENDTQLAGLFRQHLEAAANLKGRPWKVVPDYRKEVRVIYSPEEACEFVGRIRSGNIAFDFETTTLKPDGAKAEIVCCSVCRDGKEAAAFPWHGRVKRVMKHLLEREEVGKVGWSAKFEHRWCWRNGINVRGWKWDGMLSAHAIYNGGKGRAITGLKFQAYVHLGFPPYNKVVEPYLEADGGNVPNRVRELDLGTLLLYCGLDSLLEYRVSLKQKEDLHGRV